MRKRRSTVHTALKALLLIKLKKLDKSIGFSANKIAIASKILVQREISKMLNL